MPQEDGDPTDLGHILMFKLRAVNQDTLQRGIVAKFENQRDKRLGAVLLSLGLITATDLQFALDVQKLLRRGNAAEAAMLVMDYRLTKVDEVNHRVSELAETNLEALAAWEKQHG